MNPVELVNKKAQMSSSKVIFERRIRFARNLKKIPFPSAMKKKDAEKIWQIISELLLNHALFRGGYSYYAPALKKMEKILLIERRLLPPDMLLSERPAGVIVSFDEKYRVVINEEDHLRIALFSKERFKKNEFDELNHIAEYLERSLGFAKNVKQGYITSCPDNSGLGMRISGLFHLPAHSFLKKISNLISVLKEKNYHVRGYYGENSGVYGDFLQISDMPISYSGRALENSQNAFDAIEREELFQRSILRDSKHWPKFLDAVFKSVVILKNAKLISFRDAISIFSLFLLAIDLKVPLGYSELTIKNLIEEIQPAHIHYLSGRTPNASDRNIFRAQFIRKHLMN